MNSSGETVRGNKISTSLFLLDFLLNRNNEPGNDVENQHGEYGCEQSQGNEQEPRDVDVKVKILRQARANASDHFLSLRAVKLLGHLDSPVEKNPLRGKLS